MFRLVCILLASFMLAPSTSADGQERALEGAAHESSPPNIPNLSMDLGWDIVVTSSAVAGWLGLEFAKPALAPDACRWCDENLNDFDSAGRSLRWDDRAVADLSSSLIGFAVAPGLALGSLSFAAAYDGALDRRIGADILLVSEAAAIAMLLNQGVKYSFGRERPFVREFAISTPSSFGSRPGHDDNLSFYSGHTTFAFAFATASGTIASMRGYRLAPWVWANGLAAAALTGYLRIAADRHYLTDVLVGAAMGSIIGIVLPILFHSPRNVSRLSLQLAPGIAITNLQLFPTLAIDALGGTNVGASVSGIF